MCEQTLINLIKHYRAEKLLSSIYEEVSSYEKEVVYAKPIVSYKKRK